MTTVETDVTSHAAGPASMLGQVNFLFEVFPRFSLNCRTNVRKFAPYSFLGIIWLSYIIQTISILLQTATVTDLSCTTWPSFNNKQQQYLSVLMPTHCMITRFGFRARRIYGVEGGLFSNHAPLGQTTLCVGRVCRKLRLG